MLNLPGCTPSLAVQHAAADVIDLPALPKRRSHAA
jgi:hypothetical protein